MKTQFFFAPHPALSGLINNIMIGTIKLEHAEDRLSFPFPPLPEHSILFYPFDKPIVEDPVTGETHCTYNCTITGPQTERINLVIGQNLLVIKIGFQPGGLHRLLGIPMGEMLECKDYNGLDLFGSGIHDIAGEMAKVSSFADMKIIAENFLFSRVSKLKRLLPIDYVMPQILQHGGLLKIDALAKKACMSNRQFERAFKDRIGLSPKFYSRLVRFGKAWLIKENNPTTTWTEIAYRCGYFDQMHLIRDFQVFAGTNPGIIADELAQMPFSLDNRIFC